MEITKRPLQFLGLAALTITSLGCNAGLELRPKRPTFEAQAEFGGVATAHAVAAPASYEAAPADSASYDAPAEAGPTAGNYVQSGGGSVETAELTTAGATVAGRVTKGAPRFYAIDLAVGDAVSFKVYMRQLIDSHSTFEAKLLEPDLVELTATKSWLDDGPEELQRETFSATASQAGRHIIKLTSNAEPIEYRLEITGVNQAAR